MIGDGSQIVLGYEFPGLSNETQSTFTAVMPAINQFLKDIRKALQDLKAAERITKASLELEKNNKMDSLTDDDARHAYLFKDYVPNLRKIGITEDKVKLAFSAYRDTVNKAFASSPGVNNYEVQWFGKKDLTQLVLKKKGWGNAAPVPLFSLIYGDLAYEPVVVATTARTVYKRKVADLGEDFKKADNNQYVKDNRGVYTRRYAYGAKTIKGCKILKSGQPLVGKYARKVNSDIYKVDADLQKNFPTLAGSSKLKLEEMLHVNQELGSGIHQRGICLASTSKLVHGNKGEAFLQPGESVLVKVDLARVDPKIALYNLYSQPAQVLTIGMNRVREVKKNNVVIRTEKYDADESKLHTDTSTAKNRELFLEYLLWEHVVNQAEVESAIK